MRRRTFIFSSLSAAFVLALGMTSHRMWKRKKGTLRTRHLQDYQQGKMVRLSSGWVVSEAEAEMYRLWRWAP